MLIKKNITKSIKRNVKIILKILVIIGLIITISIAYKAYTQPNLTMICGEFNNYTCENKMKCDNIQEYKTGNVGYCRKSILGL